MCRCGEGGKAGWRAGGLGWLGGWGWIFGGWEPDLLAGALGLLRLVSPPRNSSSESVSFARCPSCSFFFGDKYASFRSLALFVVLARAVVRVVAALCLVRAVQISFSARFGEVSNTFPPKCPAVDDRLVKQATRGNWSRLRSSAVSLPRRPRLQVRTTPNFEFCSCRVSISRIYRRAICFRSSAKVARTKSQPSSDNGSPVLRKKKPTGSPPAPPLAAFVAGPRM